MTTQSFKQYGFLFRVKTNKPHVLKDMFAKYFSKKRSSKNFEKCFSFHLKTLSFNEKFDFL